MLLPCVLDRDFGTPKNVSKIAAFDLVSGSHTLLRAEV